VRLGSTLLIFNGTDASHVEFSDRPMLEAGGTTYLAAAAPRTPDLRDLPLLLQARTPAPIASRSRPPPPVSGIIQEANEELVFHRPLPEILDMIMNLARRAVPFERGLLMLREGERLVPQVIRVPPDESGATISVSRTITDRVLRNQESILT